ncbi:MAG: hypothetical protein GY929_11690 [Actinomycetia bacterium]|nr:hypothetical protein [Actinomycetes bacterium]
MGIVGRVVGGVVGVGLVAAGGVAFQDDAVRDETGVIQEAGEVGAFRIQVGDCLQDPGDGLIESVAAVPCSEAHEFEAYHSFDVSFVEWPGEAAISEEAGVGCYDQFFPFVGMKYEQSIYEFTWLEPTKDSFEQIDDKEVLCLVTPYEGGTKTGTARDTAQ